MYYLSNYGGWNKTHEQVEETPRVDSFDLKNIRGWSITLCGNHPIDVYFVSSDDGCILSIPGVTDDQEIEVEEKPNGYGGNQLFFICPKCGARVRFLYWNEYAYPFQCRKCAGLNYRSQQATKNAMAYYHKGMDYAQKHFESPPWNIDGFSFMKYIPSKPKGMHQKTYMKLLNRFFRYQRDYIGLTVEELKHII